MLEAITSGTAISRNLDETVLTLPTLATGNLSEDCDGQLS